jgi:hypothetical protein
MKLSVMAWAAKCYQVDFSSHAASTLWYPVVKVWWQIALFSHLDTAFLAPVAIAFQNPPPHTSGNLAHVAHPLYERLVCCVFEYPSFQPYISPLSYTSQPLPDRPRNRDGGRPASVEQTSELCSIAHLVSSLFTPTYPA